MTFAKFALQIGTACLAAVLFSACGSSEDTPSVGTILQLNHDAMRGDADSAPIQTAEKILRISEANFTVTGRYRAAADGAMRIDVFADGQRVFSEGIDDAGVWEWSGGQEAPANVDHDGVAALQHGVEFNLFSLDELRDRGHAIELVDREMVRGTRYFVLKITLKDGFENYRYVNEDTWRVEISRDFRALHPGIDASKKNLETRYDQWTHTDGILHATRFRDYERPSDQPTQTGLILKSKYNIPRAELDLDRSYVPDGEPEYE